jgi:hypothetical protein
VTHDETFVLFCFALLLGSESKSEGFSTDDGIEHYIPS